MLDDGLFPRDEAAARPPAGAAADGGRGAGGSTDPAAGRDESGADLAFVPDRGSASVPECSGPVTLVERLSAPPSPRLLALLLSLVPAELSGWELEVASVAWDRVLAAGAAEQAVLVAETLRRAPVCGPGSREFLGSELAVARGTSRRAGEALVDRADLCDREPAVWQALASGEVSAAHVDALAGVTAHLPERAASAVIAQVLPDAPGLTPAAVRAAARRAEVSLDPAAAEGRYAKAARGRCVWVEAAPESMAWVKAYLPAGDAMAVMSSLDAVAAAAAPQDARPVDVRRADAFVDLLTTGVFTGRLWRQDEEPADLYAGPEVPAGLPAPADLTGGAGPTGAAGPTGGRGLAGRSDGADRARRAARPDRGRRRAGAAVTVSLQTLTGAREGAGELAGYGPVPASIARQVAADGTWQLLGTDPAGQVRLASTRAYRPTETIAATVVARDVTCTFPGCRIPATACDLDHIDPYDHARGRGSRAELAGAEKSGAQSSGAAGQGDPGACEDQTHPDNLAPLCRHHHRMKTHGGWTPVRDPNTGITTWTSRTGQTYTRDPDPTPHDPPDPTPRAIRDATVREATARDATARDATAREATPARPATSGTDSGEPPDPPLPGPDDDDIPF